MNLGMDLEIREIGEIGVLIRGFATTAVSALTAPV